jgi:hypothetical protein
VQSQPLFVIGAPRSGTTFLCQVLNQHPCIELTNESRIFVCLKDLIETRSKRPDLIGRDFRDCFTDFILAQAGELVERFYREGLGVTAPIWGDKHPPYADPSVLSGRSGSEIRLPQSGSCLRLIRSSLPAAKFIHIHRDPSEVAYSLVRKGWTPSMADGVCVWQQYVAEIVEFFAETDPGLHLTIAYRDLLAEPDVIAARIGGFLGLPDSTAIAAFLRAQHWHPTPFSDPVRNLTEVYHPRHPWQSNGHGHAVALAGETAERLGYAAL